MALDPLLLAWMAGFLDGEGCVTINSRMTKKTPWHAPLVTVTNRNRDVLELFKASFGGYITEVHKKKAHHARCWAYMAFNLKAKNLLEILRPYLRVKALHADAVLRFSGTMRSQNQVGFSHNAAYTPTEVEARKGIIAQVRELNRKGVKNELVQ